MRLKSKIKRPQGTPSPLFKRRSYLQALYITVVTGCVGVARADSPHVPQIGPNAAQWTTLALMSPVVSALAKNAARPVSLPSRTPKAGRVSITPATGASDKLQGAWLLSHRKGVYLLSIDNLDVRENVLCRWPSAGQITVKTADGTRHLATFAQTCGVVVLDGQALRLTASSPGASAPEVLRIEEVAHSKPTR